MGLGAWCSMRREVRVRVLVLGAALALAALCEWVPVVVWLGEERSSGSSAWGFSGSSLCTSHRISQCKETSFTIRNTSNPVLARISSPPFDTRCPATVAVGTQAATSPRRIGRFKPFALYLFDQFQCARANCQVPSEGAPRGIPSSPSASFLTNLNIMASSVRSFPYRDPPFSSGYLLVAFILKDNQTNIYQQPLGTNLFVPDALGTSRLVAVV